MEPDFAAGLWSKQQLKVIFSTLEIVEVYFGQQQESEIS